MGSMLSTTSGKRKNEVMGTSDEIPPSSSKGSTFSSAADKRKNEVMGAFGEITPYASSSDSKVVRKPFYNVFINHYGPDVKNTLARVLYDMLNGKSISVFLDSEELEYGDFLPQTIVAAMASALVHIAIFSKSYAESAFCLAELSLMLKSGAKIIPIYYHVEPSDLRYVDQGKGIYVQAFKKHERKGRYSPEQLQEWKSALHRVSFYNGQIIKTNEDERRSLENTLSCVLKEINYNMPLVVAKHPIGLKEIVEDFQVNTLLSAHGNQDVQIVGIWGMGGCGKTTLAKELYNLISSSMERSSFVFNVRDAATKGLLHERQKKLLNDLGGQSLEFDTIEEGMRNLSKGFRSVRVLIVLDDVDNIEQLDALLPTKDSFKKGSLIIVTTRVYDILKSWGISSIYKMRQLNPLQAKQLFCWHAFLMPYPLDGFEELVEQFLEVCNGLPLSLKVFGSQLYGEYRKEYWESLLYKISKMLPGDIKDRLKISYDTLDDEEKEMFLDTACFFIGQKSSLAIEVWNGLGWSGVHSWQRLLDMCLVELDNDNLIRMHDHLRDLGRDIANKQSPFRLWFPQQIINVQKQVKNRISIRGIIATSNQIQWHIYRARGLSMPLPLMSEKTYEDDGFPVRCSHDALMVNTSGGTWSLVPSLIGLKYLTISGDYFNQVIGEISSELVWLRWLQIGQRSLPLSLSSKKLRVLELYEERYGGEHHLEELWGESDGEAPVQLRQLLISHCYKFQGFPKSIGHLKHLKEIIIFGGNHVTSLPDEFCLLQSLEHLDLTGSKMLSLPSNFGNLSCLRHLDLSRNRELRRLPVTFKNLIFLEHLNLEECSQLTFMSDDLQNITKLEFINFDGCKQLEELPRYVTNQASLRELYFSNTILRELPDNIFGIGQLCTLRKMKIEEVLLTSLPTSLGRLSSLTYLTIECCPKLVFLPDSLGDLSSLTNLSIQHCPNLKHFPDSLGDLSSLTNLSIQDCPNLKHLPDSLGHLSSLTDLSIQNCCNLEYCPSSIRDLSFLTNLKIIDCSKLPDSFEQLTNLEKLNLSDFKTVYSLPAEFDNLTSWQNINLKSDILLSTLPADIKQRLQFSYDALGEEEREMFLDTACFFVGEKKSRAIAVWDGSGWNGLRGLETIESKCLVELVDDPDYDGEKIIRMHDHFRDMGRQIANRQSTYRIWSLEQIINMKKHSMERKLIRGILAADAFVAFKEYMHQSMGESGRQSLSTGLKILSVEGNAFTEEIASLSEYLVWLRWDSFPLENLPSWLPLPNLRVLEIHGANELEELWEDKEPGPLELRELIITGTWSASFERFPSSISNLTFLKKIALLGDVGREFGIKGLPEDFGHLQSLEQLELRHCTMLSSLPARFGDLRSLRHLDLCSCKGLRILPNSFKQLRQLEYLDLSGCKKLSLDIDILENITELKKLNLSGCLKLRQLPCQITDQAWLRELRLQDTRLDVVPPNIGQLRKLELLTIGSPFLTRLPDSLGDLSILKRLSIVDSIDLKSLPETIGRLTLLEHLCIQSSGVRSLPKGLTELANLQTLKISGCPLGELDFGSGSSTPLGNLRVMEISETFVTRISITEDCCPRLETLHICRNDSLEKIEILPTTIKNIEISECENLKTEEYGGKLAISECSEESE